MEEKKDIRNLFLCSYNEGRIGLFRKKVVEGELYGKGIQQDPTKDFYEIYIGIDTNYTAIYCTSFNSKKSKEKGRGVVTETDTYIADCEVTGIISFNELRFIMHRLGQIEAFEIGVATDAEILKVWDYAYTYYEEEKKKNEEERQKKKEKKRTK